jgi:hypothetical protein
VRAATSGAKRNLWLPVPGARVSAPAGAGREAGEGSHAAPARACIHLKVAVCGAHNALFLFCPIEPGVLTITGTVSQTSSEVGARRPKRSAARRPTTRQEPAQVGNGKPCQQSLAGASGSMGCVSGSIAGVSSSIGCRRSCHGPRRRGHAPPGSPLVQGGQGERDAGVRDHLGEAEKPPF